MFRFVAIAAYDFRFICKFNIFDIFQISYGIFAKETKQPTFALIHGGISNFESSEIASCNLRM